jgi:hypothetical protein
MDCTEECVANEVAVCYPLCCMPKIHISSFGTEKLREFESEFLRKAERTGPTLVAIVRCWEKNDEEMRAFAKRIKGIKAGLPMLAGILLTIKKESDSGITELALRKLNTEEFGLPVAPIVVEDYTWTSGLNAGISLINELCLEENVDRQKIKMLFLSFDADLDRENLSKLKQAVDDHRFVFSVRGKVRKTEEVFAVDHLRNTLSAITLMDLVRLGGFNPLTNGFGGMEDAEFFLRLLSLAKKEGREDILVAFKHAAEEPVFYEDSRIRSMSEEKWTAKRKNETEALQKILARSYEEDLIVPSAERDFPLRLE